MDPTDDTDDDDLDDVTIAAINEAEEQADRGEGVDLQTFRADAAKWSSQER